MTLTLAIATYFIIWWLALFMVLPFVAQSQADAGEVVPGTPESAPVKTHILWVMGVTTLLATITFALVYAIMTIPQLQAAVGRLFSF